MKYVLITHEVDVYPKWKKGFDEAASLRKSAGEIEFQVLRQGKQPNTIVHFSRWISLGSARAFFESEITATIRADLGVKKPEFVYLEHLESGVLQGAAEGDPRELD
ncbi:MAG: heme-degrading monooxygenase HmoA [Gammaproteobacteria bacterium]